MENSGKNKVNIMTSCDDNLAMYILPQLASIEKNLRNYDVDFYLFHSRVSQKNIDMIQNYISGMESVSFFEVFIEDYEPYALLAEYGGKWAYEAYYHTMCHGYLPQTVDRILYIDAGDIIIDTNIEEYYFADFQGKALIGTNEILNRNLNGQLCPFEKNDLTNFQKIFRVTRGVINAGAFVINVRKFRDLNITIDDYTRIPLTLKDIFPQQRPLYFGDQGLLSVAFVGDIVYFGHPENINTKYMPYDFGLWYFEVCDELPYTPKIIHFTGELNKPWFIDISDARIQPYFSQPQNKYCEPLRLRRTQVSFYKKYWEYCAMTPVYDIIHERAKEFTQSKLF